jgi:single-strand DNA-binding protein
MSLNVNIVILAGNVTRDPETRYTPKGTAICEIGLAVNRRWKNEAGEAQEEVSFFNCVGFGRTAEIIGEYVHKGDPLHVTGRLKQETWDDKKTGEKRHAVKVILDSVGLIGSRGEEGGGTAPARPAERASRPAPAPSAPAEQDPNDDVPF